MGDRSTADFLAEGFRRPPMECEPIGEASPPTRHRRWLCGRVLDAEADSLMGEHSDKVCAGFSAKAESQADNERQSGAEHGERHRSRRRRRVRPSPSPVSAPEAASVMQTYVSTRYPLAPHSLARRYVLLRKRLYCRVH